MHLEEDRRKFWKRILVAQVWVGQPGPYIYISIIYIIHEKPLYLIHNDTLPDYSENKNQTLLFLNNDVLEKKAIKKVVGLFFQFFRALFVEWDWKSALNGFYIHPYSVSYFWKMSCIHIWNHVKWISCNVIWEWLINLSYLFLIFLGNFWVARFWVYSKWEWGLCLLIFVSFEHTRTGANKVVHLLAKSTLDMDAFTWEFIVTIVFVGFIGIIYI